MVLVLSQCGWWEDEYIIRLVLGLIGNNKLSLCIWLIEPILSWLTPTNQPTNQSCSWQFFNWHAFFSFSSVELAHNNNNKNKFRKMPSTLQVDWSWNTCRPMIQFWRPIYTRLAIPNHFLTFLMHARNGLVARLLAKSVTNYFALPVGLWPRPMLCGTGCASKKEFSIYPFLPPN